MRRYLLLLTLVVLGGLGARAQVAESADVGGVVVTVGAFGSYYEVGYGSRQMSGFGAFVDAEPKGRPGVEAEYRNLRWQQTADVHLSTYLIGPRYGFHDVHRFQPYVKVLVGDGEFSFPYGLAHGSYFVVAPGGGVDYHLNHRISFRVADLEYQDWPQFTFGNLSSFGISSGIRIRVY